MYISIEQARNELEALANKKDEYIETNILRYMEVVDNYTNTTFKLANAKDIADVDLDIYIQNKPLVEVSSLKYQATLLQVNVDYFVYNEDNLIVLENVHKFNQERRSITIDYIYGHKEVPRVVELVMLELLKLHEANLENDTLILSENMNNEYSYTNNSKTSTDLQKQILSKLNSFKQQIDIINRGNVKVYIV